MRRRTKVSTSVAALATCLLVAGVVWRRSFVAAYRAFHDPELVDEAEMGSPRGDRRDEPVQDEVALDRQLAADFVELSGLELVLDDEARLADLRPEDLPVPITRRTLRYLKFFTADPRGRRAFEHLYRRSGRYRDHLLTELREARLPEDLMWLAAVESNFDPSATSPAKAAGLWQLMPALARDHGLRLTPWLDERRSLDASTRVAVRHLGHLHEQLGAWDLALAAYNMGQTALQDAVVELRLRREQRGEPPGHVGVAQLAHEGLLPKETADYVPKIAAVAVVASNLERFQFDSIDPDPSLRGAPVVVPSETRLSTLAKAAGVPVATLRELNPELLTDATPPGAEFQLAVPASQIDRTLATLPVYLDQAASEAEGLDVLAAATLTEPAPLPPSVEPVEPPFRLMAAWLDAVRVQTVLGEPTTLLANVPGRLGGPAGGGLMRLGDVALHGAGDPLQLLRPGAWATAMPTVAVPMGEGAARTAAIADRHLEEALGFLHGSPREEEVVGQGVTLRLERDPSLTRVAITVSLGEGSAADLAGAPITTAPVWETSGELRHTEVVRPTELDVGLRVAVSRLGLWLAQGDDASSGAARASLNRHRRVAVGQLAEGEAWLALADLMFPVGDPQFGRLFDPRGVDGAWLADRLLLSEHRTARRPSDATITVAGHFEPDRVRVGVRAAVAGLGIGIAGRVPSTPSSNERRRVVDLPVSRRELLLAHPFAGLEADDHAAALVALEVLAGDKRSIVRGGLVDERLADAYRADVDPDWDRSVAILRLTPSEGTDPLQLERALDQLVTRLADEGPTGVELAYAQTMVRSRLGKQLKASRRHRPDAPTSATRLLEAVRPGTLAAWHGAVGDVSRRDVQRALRAYFEAPKRVVVEIRPSQPPGEVAKR